MTRQTFFEHAVLERDLSNDFLELPVLASQIFDFVAGRFSDRVASQLLLARFEKVLAPAVVEVRSDAFSATQAGDALLASQPFEYDADLLFGRELSSGAAPDLAHRRFGGLLLLGHIETLHGVFGPGKCLLD